MRRRIPIMTECESRAHVKLLRAQGFYVRAFYLPDGSKLYVRSRKPIKCAAHHHCTALLAPTGHHRPAAKRRHHKKRGRSKRR